MRFDKLWLFEPRLSHATSRSSVPVFRISAMKQEQPGSSRVHCGDTSYRRTLSLFRLWYSFSTFKQLWTLLCLHCFCLILKCSVCTAKEPRAATKIQALMRKFILRRRMIRQNKAAIMIQTFWKGYVARETLRMLKKEIQFALQNAAATVIQAYSGLR